MSDAQDGQRTAGPVAHASGGRRIGIGFGGGPYSVQRIAETVRLAERYGFESAWMTNDVGGRTPYVVLAVCATVTKRVRLGVAVSNPVTRHPVELAQTVATLDEACKGRAVLGIGTGASWRSLISGEWANPIGLMREAVQVMRDLWAMPEARYRGVPVSIRGSDWVFPTGGPAAIRADIPIYLGAAGPQMTRLAARRADGLLIALGKFVPDIEDQVSLFRETAAKAGRAPDSLEVGALITTAVAESSEDLEVLRRYVAFEVHRMSEDGWRRRGLDLVACRKIKDVYARYADEDSVVRYGMEPAGREASVYVTDSMLAPFAVFGSPRECAGQLEKYVTAGVDLPIVHPFGCDPERVIEVGRIFLSQYR